MMDKKNVRQLKNEVKAIEKKISSLEIGKRRMESKGCFSDQELSARDKKVNAVNSDIRFLINEMEKIKQDMVSIEREKLLKKMN